MDTNLTDSKTETSTLAGGCFWCLEAIYKNINGVKSVKSGFMGGHKQNPTYREVCNGNTGHAEVCQIVFCPDIISFDELIRIFFEIHDPTTKDRQGNDIGEQYRSAIFYHSLNQKQIALKIIDDLTEKKSFKNPIVTEVSEASIFYPAEDYHDDYFKNNPNAAYCRFVIKPKVDKFNLNFKHLINN